MSVPTIVKAENREQRLACYALRRAVFVEEQGVPIDLEQDVHDETDAIHLMAVLKDEIVGTARLIPYQDGVKFGRLAVRREARGQGIADHLIRSALDMAVQQDGCNAIVLDAQADVTGMYTRYGFRRVGEIFDDAGIPHQRMWLQLIGN